MKKLNFLHLSRFLKLRQYQHLNKILISKSAIENNYKALSRLHSESVIAPVVKSNAYGHGLKSIASIFDKLNPPFLMVDSLYEAYELKKLKVKTKILLLGYTKPENFSVKKLPFEYAVSDIETVEALNKYQSNCNIHLFIDTGMSREGIRLEYLESFIHQLKNYQFVNVVGLCSHLSSASSKDDITKEQIKLFKQALSKLNDKGINPQWRHISASDGAFKLFDPAFNLIRAGLSLYGINPFPVNDRLYNKISLQPALTLKSTIVQIKKIKSGDKVGYDGTYIAKNSMTIGLVPAGYNEGVDLRLSNIGFVKVGNNYCKIIGSVSMNITIIDLTDIENVKVGTECIIFSNNDEDKNSISQSARLIKTKPYELLVHLHPSIKRIIVD